MSKSNHSTKIVTVVTVSPPAFRVHSTDYERGNFTVSNGKVFPLYSGPEGKDPVPKIGQRLTLIKSRRDSRWIRRAGFYN